MQHPTAATFFIVITFAVSVAAVGQPWRRDVINTGSCSKPGQLVCSSDCQKAQVCLGDGQGGYITEDVQVCGEGTKCSYSYGTCVEAGLSDCHIVGIDAPFPCYEAGAFPDPYNCTMYHVCIQAGGTAYAGICKEGSAFNPLTSDCSLNTSDRVCTEGPIKVCRRTGELGVVPENPALYYICTVIDDQFVPQIHKCRGDNIFDLRFAECISPTEPPPEMCGDCRNVNEIAADPENCQAYYMCGPKNRWLQDQCLPGYHFEPDDLECQIGSSC